MQSQYGPTSAGKGHENRRPWVQKGAPQVKFRPTGGPLESSWGVLGAKSASEGRSGRKRGVWKLKGGLLGPSWGPPGASWAHFGSQFPPPWGAPGRLQEVIFGIFWDVPAEILKMSFCLSSFHIFGVSFSVLLFALCCLPCCVAGGVVHMQKKRKFFGFCGSQAICALFWQRPKQSTFRGDA